MSNFFKKFSPFKNLISQSEQSVIGIDIGTSSVKVIQLKGKKGKAVLETYGALSTGPYADLAVGQTTKLSPEKLAELLKDLFVEANITSRTGSLSIPLRSSLLLTIQLPKVAHKNLAEAVPIEARKYVPVPISEVALDWWEVPPPGGEESKANNQKTNVLLVAIHKDTLNQYEKLFNLSGVKPQFFEIETFSVMRSVLSRDLSSIMLVDFGAVTTKVSVIDYGVVRTSHTINKGSQDITSAISRSQGISFAKAEEIKRQVGLTERLGGESLQTVISPVVEYIFSEVSKVMVNYQEKNARAIEQIVLIGGGSLLKGLHGIAKDSLSAPVVLGAPFNRLEAPEFLDDVFKEIGPEFAVAIGLALRGLES